MDQPINNSTLSRNTQNSIEGRSSDQGQIQVMSNGQSQVMSDAVVDAVVDLDEPKN